MARYAIEESTEQLRAEPLGQPLTIFCAISILGLAKLDSAS
jgi:hypothetical protein